MGFKKYTVASNNFSIGLKYKAHNERRVYTASWGGNISVGFCTKTAKWISSGQQGHASNNSLTEAVSFFMILGSKGQLNR